MAADPRCAPRRWTVAPFESLAVAFAVAWDREPVLGGVRYCRHPGECPGWDSAPWALAVAEGDVVGDDGRRYRLYRATLPPLGREGGYRYQCGYRRATGWQWGVGGQVMVTLAPRRMGDVPQGLVGVVDGVPVVGPLPPKPLTPAPRDWRRRLCYTVMIDRFAPGDPSRWGLGWVTFDPNSPFAAHGGDLLGLGQQLDYLQALGVGVLVLSPVYANNATGYHGYHPVHLLAVDPRYGTLGDLQGLVAQAHAKGMAVVLDVLVNHTADLITWARDGAGQFHFDAEGWGPNLLPEELQSVGFFHAPGQEDLTRTPLFGFLDDWCTEHPYVARQLVDHLKYWLAMTDVDGFRFDAVRHVELAFWQAGLAELKRYANAVGKTDFFCLGEHADHRPQEVGRYSKGAAFSGMLDYPLYYLLRDTLTRDPIDLTALNAHFDRAIFAYRDSRYNLAFLDNQDTSRLRHLADRWGGGDEATAWALQRCALALLILGPQIPCLYYGTEQAFAGAHLTLPNGGGEGVGVDCYVREDMFPNPHCWGPVGPVNRPRYAPFERRNPVFRWIRHLAHWRAALPALWRGDRHGIADGRVWLALMWAPEVEDLALVVVNFSRESQSRSLALATLAPTLPAPGRGVLQGREPHLVSGGEAVSAVLERETLSLVVDPWGVGLFHWSGE
ncbi:MAG: alpha-amylase family glycosyl hydrolase [Candidatus Competibacterales bacterium]